MTLRTLSRSHALAVFLATVSVLFACSSDTPTRPKQTEGTGGGQPPATTTWNISVTVTPSTIELSNFYEQTARVTVTVRNAATGESPVNGTSIVLSAELGAFTDNTTGNGEKAVAFELYNGSVSATYYAPSYFPPTGVDVIQARLEDSIGQAEIRIVNSLEPYISHMEPSVGRPEGGYTAAVVGGGFSEPATAVLGSLPAPVRSVSDTRIVIEVPPIDLATGQTQTVGIEVTVGQGTDNPTTVRLSNAFTYAREGDPFGPQVYSLTPNQGPNEGGTSVLIRGANFENEVQVLFGLVEATVNSVRSGEIVVTTPPATGFGQNNENSTVDVTITNVNNGQTTTAGSAFTYGVAGGGMFISSIGPAEGPSSGGTRVLITGFGFDEPVAVEMGGVGQQVLSVTGTEIIVRTVPIEVNGCGDVSGETRVVNIETGESATGPIFTYRVPQAVILSVNPSSGDEDGGNSVVISGVDLEAPATVTFGDNTASTVTVTSSTSANVVVPAFTGTWNTEACDDDGDGTQGTRNLATSVDVTWDNPLSGCNDSLTNAYTYVPDDQSCQNDAGPPEPPEPVTVSFAVNQAGNNPSITVLPLTTGTINSYTWLWGDGTSDVGNGAPGQTSHNYTTTLPSGAGQSVTITLQVVGDSGSAQAQQGITVDVP